MSIVVLTSGQLADLLRSKWQISTTHVRKAFTCGAFLAQTIFMLSSAYTQSVAAAVICLTIAVGFGGFAWSGFSVNQLDIAPQYASVIMGISNTVATLPGIISPSITGFIVQNKVKRWLCRHFSRLGQVLGSFGHQMEKNWRSVFIISAGIYLAGAVAYGIWASGDLQSWATKRSGLSTRLKNYRDGLGMDLSDDNEATVFLRPNSDEF